MHAGQVSYTPYQQLDGENEHEITEIVCRNYPHPPPVAIEDLSSEHKEILESIIQGSRGRLPERRGKTRRYAAIFDDKGLPLPSATGVMIGGPRSSMLSDGESETEPIVVAHAVVASGKSTGIGAALRRGISSAARSVLTCCPAHPK